MNEQPEQPDQAPAPKPKRKYRRTGLPKGRKRVRDGTTERYRAFWAPDELLADYLAIASAINRRKLKRFEKRNERKHITLNALYVAALQDWAKRAKKRLNLDNE